MNMAGTMRSCLALSWVVVASALGSCSLVIDVPADCTDDQCGAYVCGEDGIACLAECSSDMECASGYVCDLAASACAPTGCAPAFDARPLEGLPDTITEFSVSAGSDPEQLMVVVGRNQGLGFRRYNANGALVGDLTDEALGLVRLADANEDRLPFYPMVRYADEVDSEVDGGSPRFLVGWRDVGSTRDAFVIGTFVVQPPSPPRSQTLRQERAATEISSFDFLPNGIGLFATWQAKSGQIGEVFTQDTALDGTPGEGEPWLVSPEDRLATHSTLVRSNDRYYTFYASAGAGTRNLVGQAFDATNEYVGNVRLRAEAPATRFTVADIVGTSSDTVGTVAWMEDNGDGAAIYYAPLGDGVASVLGRDVTVVLEVYPLAEGFSELSNLQSADDQAGAFVGWLGERNGRADIWVQRLGADGGPRFTPLGAVGPNGRGAVDQYAITALSDGLGVVWRVEGEGSAPDQLYYRRFTCDW